MMIAATRGTEVRWASAVAATALCLILGCDLFSPKKSTDIKNTVETKPETGVKTGDGSDVRVWNISLASIGQRAGWGGYAIGVLFAAMLWRCRRGLWLVVRSIEEGDCKDCKRCVSSYRDRWLNKRVRKWTKSKRR